MPTSDTFVSSVRTLVAAAICSAAVHAQAPDLQDMLTRVGERVQEYYSRAQSIICLETVTMQPLGYDWGSSGRARVLEYELRISWEPRADGLAPEATVLRRVLTVDGRPPKPDAEPVCMDPRAVSAEPLALLLPGNQAEYLFASAGAGRSGNRPARMIDYKSLAIGKAQATWRGTCVSFDLPGRTAGRIWIDAATHDVLRLDESLVGRFDYRIPREHAMLGSPMGFEIERADSSIRYRRVTFHDPDETVLLPEIVESLQVVRGAGVPRMRTTQIFSNYQRFVTEGRVVR